MYDPSGAPRPSIDLNSVSGKPGNMEVSHRWKRPLGVMLIAIWMFLGGVVTALFAFLGMPSGDPSTFTSIYFLISCLYILLIPMYIVLGVGLWQLRPWARAWTIAICVVGVVLSLCTLPISGSEIPGIILNMVAPIYLFQPHVIDTFDRYRIN